MEGCVCGCVWRGGVCVEGVCVWGGWVGVCVWRCKCVCVCVLTLASYPAVPAFFLLADKKAKKVGTARYRLLEP